MRNRTFRIEWPTKRRPEFSDIDWPDRWDRVMDELSTDDCCCDNRALLDVAWNGNLDADAITLAPEYGTGFVAELYGPRSWFQSELPEIGWVDDENPLGLCQVCTRELSVKEMEAGHLVCEVCARYLPIAKAMEKKTKRRKPRQCKPNPKLIAMGMLS